MTESFAELFEASQTNLAKLKPGSIVTGTVVEVRGDVVVINAGSVSYTHLTLPTNREV